MRCSNRGRRCWPRPGSRDSFVPPAGCVKPGGRGITVDGKAMLTASEHDIQATFVAWARLQERVEPRLRLLFAIPNGARTTRSVSKRLKAEGMVAGVWDVFLPVPSRSGASGLWIEFKTPDGRVSMEQSWFGLSMRQMGFAAVICRSVDEAIATVNAHLGVRLEGLDGS